MWKLGSKLVKKFEELTEQHGGVNSQDIARVDWRDPQAVKDFRADPECRRKFCIQLGDDVSKILGKLIEEETSK